MTLKKVFRNENDDVSCPDRHTIKAITACALAFIVFGCGAPSKFLAMKLTSSVDASAGVIRHYFSYDGGCLEVAMDTNDLWQKIKPKFKGVSLFERGGYQSTPGLDPKVAFALRKVEPGTDLQNYPEQWRRSFIAAETKRMDKLVDKYGLNFKSNDGKPRFQAGEIKKTTLGSGPNAREAYTCNYVTTIVLTDWRVNGDIRTTTKTGYEEIADIYFVVEGKSLVQITFSSPAEFADRAGPDFEKVKASFRFGNCTH